MEELFKEFEDKQEKFHDTIENYPLFQEHIDQIFDKDIKEIEDLLDKDDEYYLKKAIRKLDDVIDYIKKTSTEISDLYREYEKMVKVWDSMIVNDNVPDDVMEKLNKNIVLANSKINTHTLKDIKEAVKLLSSSIKELKDYNHNL